ncbi:DNA polymerase subunit gamma-2, mitochondrial [Sergentomyia squamirostris]
MRYSANPGRYRVSEATFTDIPDGKVQKVSIQSTLKDSFLDLESIELISLKSGKDFQLTDPRSGKQLIPAIVRTGICLDIATVGVLFDAVDSADETESLLLHRKIAPHQLAIFCYPGKMENLPDLQDLARLIAINTRKVGISTLNLPKCSTSDEGIFSRELLQMDQLGTPYCIILTDDSLRSGLLNLRSRDTTLSETIHLTDIPSYLQKIFSSF